MDDRDERPGPALLPEDVEEVGRIVLDAAFAVHRAFGPGALESVYRQAMTHALESRGLRVETEVRVPIVFEGATIAAALRIDLRVNGLVIVELKAVERIHPVHVKQIVTYLRLTGAPLGYILNFEVPLMKEGIRRFVNV